MVVQRELERTVKIRHCIRRQRTLKLRKHRSGIQSFRTSVCASMLFELPKLHVLLCLLQRFWVLS
jgi:hypothetical protein